MFSSFIHLCFRLIFISSFVLILACENDIEKVKLVTKISVLPDATMTDSEIIYTDSALIKVKLTSPEIKKYDLPKNPYIEFPKGIKVEFYNDSEIINSTITAKYAIYFQEKELWEARNDVVAVNDKGEQLNTEQLFWDQKNEFIYSKKFTKITNKDGVFQGKNGFEAEQNFTKWKLIGSEGTVNVKEDEE